MWIFTAGTGFQYEVDVPATATYAFPHSPLLLCFALLLTLLSYLAALLSFYPSKLFIRLPSSSSICRFFMFLFCSVATLKEAISTLVDIPEDSQILLCGKVKLNSNRTLLSYNLPSVCTPSSASLPSVLLSLLTVPLPSSLER
jgi:hypothetical protein